MKDILEPIRQLPFIECGQEAAKYFAFDEGYTFLNHGRTRQISTTFAQ